MLVESFENTLSSSVKFAVVLDLPMQLVHFFCCLKTNEFEHVVRNKNSLLSPLTFEMISGFYKNENHFCSLFFLSVSWSFLLRFWHFVENVFAPWPFVVKIFFVSYNASSSYLNVSAWEQRLVFTVLYNTSNRFWTLKSSWCNFSVIYGVMRMYLVILKFVAFLSGT